MRRVFIILTLITAMSLQAQVTDYLVDTNKLWSNLYRSCLGCPPPYIRKSNFVKFSGDSIIGQNTYYKIWQSEDSLMANWIMIGLIREDSTHKVYHRMLTDTSDFLLYDFGLQPGDTFMTQLLGPIVVDSVDSVLVYDKYVRRITFKGYKDGQGKGLGIQWYEGIGDLSGVLSVGWGAIVGALYDLLCYYEGNVLKYHLPTFWKCYENNVGLASTGPPMPRITISPNPVTDQSVLSLAGIPPGRSQLEIFSPTGQRVYSGEFNERMTLPVHSLPGGIYLCRVASGGAVFSGKFVKR